MAQGNVSHDLCTNYSVLNNHPIHYEDENLQLDATQFCEAFFHVPEVVIYEQGEENKETDMECLEEDNCRVFDKRDQLQKKKTEEEKKKKKKERRQPKHVVCFVVLKRGKQDEYKALYENCWKNDEGQKKHAEEFFYVDLKKKLDKIMTSQMGALVLTETERELNTSKLYMYITLQPCHNSTENSPDKSCTEVLIELYKDILEPLHIEFIVKPTFILKAYWPISKEGGLNQQIEKAKEGLKLLHEKGIQIEAMKEEDWTYLREQLCPSVELFPGSSYGQSQRKKLDVFIRKFLRKEGVLTRTTTQSSGTSGSRQGGRSTQSSGTSGSDSTSSGGSD